VRVSVEPDERNDTVLARVEYMSGSPTAKDRPNWPTEICCKMHIPGWESELTEARFSMKYANVIQGLKSGFNQGIPRNTLQNGVPFYTPENHTSAKQAQGKIEDNIRDKITAGVELLINQNRALKGYS
jgi:hypothetical protein